MKPNQNPPVCRAPRNLQLNTHITVTAILIAALLSVCSWTTIGQSADQGDKDLRQQSLAQLVKLAELATTQERKRRSSGQCHIEKNRRDGDGSFYGLRRP